MKHDQMKSQAVQGNDGCNKAKKLRQQNHVPLGRLVSKEKQQLRWKIFHVFIVVGC